MSADFFRADNPEGVEARTEVNEKSNNLVKPFSDSLF
jgi:hypothetical protein